MSTIKTVNTNISTTKTISLLLQNV